MNENIFISTKKIESMWSIKVEKYANWNIVSTVVVESKYYVCSCLTDSTLWDHMTYPVTQESGYSSINVETNRN